jgi:hypothetical protein
MRETPSNEEVMDAFKAMWSAEPVNFSTEDKVFSPAERNALHIFETSIKMNDRKYEIAVPWCQSPELVLSNNFVQASDRLTSLEKRFETIPEKKSSVR